MVDINQPTPPEPSFNPMQATEAYPKHLRSQHSERLTPNMRVVPPALLHSRGANMGHPYSNRQDRIEYYEDTSELSSQQNSLTSFWKGWIHGISNFFKGCFKSSRELTIDTDLEMERGRYRYIREAHAKLDNENGVSDAAERGSSDRKDRDFPSAEIMESLEGSPVVSYGTSVPPAEDIEDTSEVFALSKRECNRTAEQKGAMVDTQNCTPGLKIDKNELLKDQNMQNGGMDSLEMSSKMVKPLPDEWNSSEPCEAPVLDKKKGDAASASKCDPQTVVEHSMQETKAGLRVNGCKSGERIRFSRRDKKRTGRRAKGDDPLLNYRWDESTMEEGIEELTTSMMEDVDKLHRMLDSESAYRQNLVDLGRDGGLEEAGGERVGLVEEVQSFVDDVTKAAEDMVRATKRRSDLFIERIRGMEVAEVPRQEAEFERLLRKVAECEKVNRELRESLTRAKEQCASSVIRGVDARREEESRSRFDA